MVLVFPGVTMSGQPPMSHLRLLTVPAVKANHVLDLVHQLCSRCFIGDQELQNLQLFSFHVFEVIRLPNLDWSSMQNCLNLQKLLTA